MLFVTGEVSFCLPLPLSFLSRQSSFEGLTSTEKLLLEAGNGPSTGAMLLAWERERERDRASASAVSSSEAEVPTDFRLVGGCLIEGLCVKRLVEGEGDLSNWELGLLGEWA